jgi:hypothetical protein
MTLCRDESRFGLVSASSFTQVVHTMASTECADIVSGTNCGLKGQAVMRLLSHIKESRSCQADQAAMGRPKQI